MSKRKREISLHILALEPYYGGSHQAFLDGWQERSRHRFTILSLPAHKWKWRMRHAAITLADQVAAIPVAARDWDAVFCSDMLNLAEFAGLVDASVCRLPRIVYFHENQWTYLSAHPDQRDFHFGFTNYTTALAAKEVWFNSAFHRNDFLTATKAFLQRMPDFRSLETIEQIRAKSIIASPGISVPTNPAERAVSPTSRPLRILWAARWEYDKNPETFFCAIEELVAMGQPVRISVIGESFAEAPTIFAKARQQFDSIIDYWGYQDSHEDYQSVLKQADVIVSTARHEFFGLSVAEAIAHGCFPVLPERLAYPDLLELNQSADHQRFFYDGTVEGLVARLTPLSSQMSQLFPLSESARQSITRFSWNRVAGQMDKRISELIDDSHGPRAQQFP